MVGSFLFPILLNSEMLICIEQITLSKSNLVFELLFISKLIDYILYLLKTIEETADRLDKSSLETEVELFLRHDRTASWVISSMPAKAV